MNEWMFIILFSICTIINENKRLNEWNKMNVKCMYRIINITELNLWWHWVTVMYVILLLTHDLQAFMSMSTKKSMSTKIQCINLVSPENLSGATYVEFLNQNFLSKIQQNFSFPQYDLGLWKTADLGWYKIGQGLYARIDPKNWKIGSLFTFIWIFSLFREFASLLFVWFMKFFVVGESQPIGQTQSK